jgi:hypothetical protein
MERPTGVAFEYDRAAEFDHLDLVLPDSRRNTQRGDMHAAHRNQERHPYFDEALSL